MAGEVIKIGRQKVPVMWNIGEVGIKAVNSLRTMSQQTGPTKYFSSLPIKCNGKENCIYKDSCYLDKAGVNPDDCIGQVCPIEVEMILNLFDSYSAEFNLKDLDDKKNTTVVGLLKDLIDTELQIERANKRIRLSGEYLEDRAIGVSDSTGEVITNKEINQHIVFREKMQDRKNKILNLLNATPKDKSSESKGTRFSPDAYAAELIKKARDLNMIEIDDIQEVEDEKDEHIEVNAE